MLGDGAVSVGRLRWLESTVLSIRKKRAAKRERERESPRNLARIPLEYAAEC